MTQSGRQSRRHEWQRVSAEVEICRRCAVTSRYEDRYVHHQRAPYTVRKRLRVLRYPDGREASVGSPMAPCEAEG